MADNNSYMLNVQLQCGECLHEIHADRVQFTYEAGGLTFHGFGACPCCGCDGWQLAGAED